MPRGRIDPARRTRRAGPSEVARLGERVVARVEELVDQVVAVRADNDSLRADLRHALDQLARVSGGDGLAPGRAQERRRPGRQARAGRSRGRATPEGVTSEVVKAVIAKLGPSTAAEIAAEIGRFGEPVSGRAVRFLAEKAGAQTVMVEGRRLYRV